MAFKVSNNVKAVGQRMVRAAASAVISVGVVGGGLNAFDLDYQNLAGVGLGAALVSLLFSLAGQATGGDGPAFGSIEQVTTEKKGN